MCSPISPASGPTRHVQRFAVQSTLHERQSRESTASSGWRGSRSAQLTLWLFCASLLLIPSGPAEALPEDAGTPELPAVVRRAAGRTLVGVALIGWSVLAPDDAIEPVIRIRAGRHVGVNGFESHVSTLLAYGMLAGAPFLGGGIARPGDRAAQLRGLTTASVTTAVIGAAYAVRTYAKQCVSRPRPGVDPHSDATTPDDFQSFPSGHALLSWACVGDALAGWMTGRREAWVPVVFTAQAAVVSLLRWTSGEHYAGDVLVGSATGLALGTALSLLTRQLGQARSAP